MIRVKQLVTVKAADISSYAWNVRYFIHYFSPLASLMAVRCREPWCVTEYALWNEPWVKEIIPNLQNDVVLIYLLNSSSMGSIWFIHWCQLLTSPYAVECFFASTWIQNLLWIQKPFFQKQSGEDFIAVLCYISRFLPVLVSSSYKMTGWTLQKPLRSWH